MNLAVNFAYVGLGGAVGACSRYSLSLMLAAQPFAVPYATLVANVAGAFIAGFFATYFISKALIGGSLHLLLVVGFLGGFTTFSAFSVETLRLAEAGNYLVAAANVGLNLFGSLVAVTAGAYLARWYAGA
nr:fluoride efflux transporter CrcB [Granulosicoccus sp.]